MLENSYCMDAFLEALDAPMKDEALQNKRVMNENRIKTKHPEGKSGVSISKEKYDAMRAAILDCLDEKGEMTYTELTKDINEKLKDKFKGSINWYVECVKLDLEARCIVAEFVSI
jgi:hypothetical protein